MPDKTLKSVVILEDDPDICTVVSLLLKKYAAIETTACSSPEELISTLRAAKPHLLVLDMMLPGKNGMDTLKELRGMPEFTNIPALFLTAYKFTGSDEEKKELGVIGVIRKPFDPYKLHRQIIEMYETSRSS